MDTFWRTMTLFWRATRHESKRGNESIKRMELVVWPYKKYRVKEMCVGAVDGNAERGMKKKTATRGIFREMGHKV